MKTIKGEELTGRELEVLDDGTLRLIEKKYKKFIPKVDEKFWYLECGEIVSDINDGAYNSNWIINHQPVFRTEKECEEYKKFLELLDKYKYELDWEDDHIIKSYLYYIKKFDEIYIGGGILMIQGIFYFKSLKLAQEFIEEAGKENIKRFMFDIWE